MAIEAMYKGRRLPLSCKSIKFLKTYKHKKAPSHLFLVNMLDISSALTPIQCQIKLLSNSSSIFPS